MTEQTGQPSSAPTDRQSVEAIERVAGVLAQLSSELSEISARLRSQTEATERDDPGREATNRTREPLSGARQRIPASREPAHPSGRETRPAIGAAGSSSTETRPAEICTAETSPAEISLGEPVDTSFALPARVPAATAAGSAGSRGPADFRGPADSRRPADSRGSAGLRGLAGFAGSVGLLGLVVVVTVALTRGWYAPLAQVLAGAVLGIALFAGALWLHHKSTGRPL